MVKSKEELIQTVSTIAGETPSDEMIALLEDIADSFVESTGNVDNTEEIAAIQAEADAKCLAIEAEWKAKYIARFSGVVEPNVEEKEVPVTVDASMFE